MIEFEYWRPEPLVDATVRLASLRQQARDELALLSYPTREWRLGVASQEHIYDVIIIGGGQSGLVTAHGLKRQQVTNIAVLDQRPKAKEGVWHDFARMKELLTPKALNGIDFGQPSLSVQHWFFAKYGAQAWEQIERIPLSDWTDFLEWYRITVEIEISNDHCVKDINWRGDAFELQVETPSGPETMRASIVILATGFDGGGEWAYPAHLAQNIQTERIDHSNSHIDFKKYRGQHVGILGHGSSAFDAAVSALESGAARVDVCFRRDKIPRANPYRYIENAGLLSNYAELTDETRWQVAVALRERDQPPAKTAFALANKSDRFHMHAGCGWLSTAMTKSDTANEAGEKIAVSTTKGAMTFDYVICATGLKGGMTPRPELASISPFIQLWSDRLPKAEAHNSELAAYPYLDTYFQFTEKTPGEAPWLSRLFAFNALARVSMSLIASTISGHKYIAPRLIRGVVKQLFLDQENELVASIRNYDADDLNIPPTRLSEAGYCDDT